MNIPNTQEFFETNFNISSMKIFSKQEFLISSGWGSRLNRADDIISVSETDDHKKILSPVPPAQIMLPSFALSFINNLCSYNDPCCTIIVKNCQTSKYEAW